MTPLLAFALGLLTGAAAVAGGVVWVLARASASGAGWESRHVRAAGQAR